MKNKRRIKIAVLAALAACVTLLCSSCVKKIYHYTGRTEKFGPGNHTISVPLGCGKDARMEAVKYEDHEGYEIVCVSMDKGYTTVVYRNTVTVECPETEDGYVVFGNPVKQLTMEN